MEVIHSDTATANAFTSKSCYIERMSELEPNPVCGRTLL